MVIQMNELFISNLTSQLTNVFDQKILISEMKLMTEGWESKIFSFVGKFEKNQKLNQNLVIRIFQGENTENKAEKEFTVMKFLHKEKISVPSVYLLDLSKKYQLNFIVMEKIEGKILGDLIIENLNNPEIVIKLLEAFVKIQKSIHEIEIPESIKNILPFAQNLENSFLDKVLDYFSQQISNLNTNIFDEFLNWLLKNKILVENYHSGLVHMDYHPWNALINKNNEIFVIDWAQVMYGDIRLDIAWTLILCHHDSFFEFIEKAKLIYENYYTKEELKNLDYFMSLAGLRRILDAYQIIKGNSKEQGLNPEAKKQVIQMSRHYYQVIKILEANTKLNLQLILKELTFKE
jgi:aminoglycoside phosphotransferase (APT) family kinase protein